MAEFILFLQQQWMLSLAFCIVLGLLIGTEIQHHLSGVCHLTIAQATEWINRQDARIIDIRPSDAFANGHMIDAINIPRDMLATGSKSLAQDKPVIVACANGQQSKAAAAQLRKLGFSQVGILQEGIQGWKNANLPIINGKNNKS